MSPLLSSSASTSPSPSSALVRFEHPRANRHARLGDALVAYEFKRAKRRTIGFVIGADGLVVSAPRWVPLAEVDIAVQDKGSWIVRKLGQSRERQQRMLAAHIEWKDGAELPYLGRTVRLALDPRHGFGAAGAQLDDTGALLRLSLPQAATPEQIRDSVQAWLMRQAKALFTERMDHYAPRLGVQWRRLSLSSAGTRWGSASANGSIRLHWRLIHFRLDVIDYVVVHELSHLRVMDHSPRFWDTVATVVPDYAALRGQLRDEAIPRWA
jgi:predicted metal-dependent hydrolase